MYFSFIFLPVIMIMTLFGQTVKAARADAAGALTDDQQCALSLQRNPQYWQEQVDTLRDGFADAKTLSDIEVMATILEDQNALYNQLQSKEKDLTKEIKALEKQRQSYKNKSCRPYQQLGTDIGTLRTQLKEFEAISKTLLNQKNNNANVISDAQKSKIAYDRMALHLKDLQLEEQARRDKAVDKKRANDGNAFYKYIMDKGVNMSASDVQEFYKSYGDIYPLLTQTLQHRLNAYQQARNAHH